MTTHATGPFDVKIEPQASDQNLGRMSLDKQWHGDIQATSKGEMLTVGSAVGSGVYVAVERVTGTVHGKRGTFSLVHQGILSAAGQQLTIFVSPDSGTDELVGMTGTVDIHIAPDGAHSYDLAYTLP